MTVRLFPIVVLLAALTTAYFCRWILHESLETKRTGWMYMFDRVRGWGTGLHILSIANRIHQMSDMRPHRRIEVEISWRVYSGNKFFFSCFTLTLAHPATVDRYRGVKYFTERFEMTVYHSSSVYFTVSFDYKVMIRRPWEDISVLKFRVKLLV